jgi:hypothetical protein
MSAGQMLVGQMLVGQMSAGQMLVGQMSVGQMSCASLYPSLAKRINVRLWLKCLKVSNGLAYSTEV